jgi:hypothetical protein
MLFNSLFAPVGIVLIFTSVILLKGQSLREARTKIIHDVPKTFIAGTCYWTFVSFINFRFILLNYRPLVGSLAGAIWNIYLSSIINKKTTKSNRNIRPLIGARTTLLNKTDGTASSTLREG